MNDYKVELSQNSTKFLEKLESKYNEGISGVLNKLSSRFNVKLLLAALVGKKRVLQKAEIDALCNMSGYIYDITEKHLNRLMLYNITKV